jgi:copper(I)-binding protein
MPHSSRRLILAALFAFVSAGGAAAYANAVGVADAWTRPALIGANGAGYLTLVNHDRFDDTLTGLASPDAAAVTLHESRMVGGVMTMRPLPALAVPAGRSTALAPGGLHVMLRGLKRTLKTGDQVVLFITFAKAGRVRTILHVRPTATPDPMAGMKM